jgi:superfamily II DNA or RNA helicase
MTSLAQLIDRLPAEPTPRGKAFERLCQWYLRNEPVYAGQLRHVWLWDEWPGRFGPDAGIDLVAETAAGDLWAVQAKAYGPEYSVTKADVDSFLSESGRPVFSYRLLVATTNRISARAEKTLDEQAIPAGIVRLSQLERAEVSWPASLDALRPRRSEPKLPRPHSSAAVEAVCAGFGRHDRGQLVMACGTGKTLIGLWVSERLGCQRVLVMVPSLSLLSQTLREWARSAAMPFSWLAACSDPTVEADDLVERTSELGIPVTTDPEAIAGVLARPGRHVLFATYQSSPRIAAAARLGAPAFDLVIADEAHRTAGVVDSAFATVVDPDAIPARRRLFMTATPRYFTDRLQRAAERSDLEVASMDDPARFGRVFHRLSFAEAISRGLLSDYQVLVIGVDDAVSRDMADRGALVTSEGLGVTDARRLASQIGLAKAMRDHDLHRVVSFHQRIAGARRFAAGLPVTVSWMPPGERPSGEVWAKHVSGAMPAGQRDTLLGRFRDLEPGTRGVLSNARCLGEGVDVPAIDAVAFIDPRRSAIDVTQAVGRAIRLSRDKVKGTVVLPVFVDAAADAEQLLDSSVFRPVWEVLRALRAHDDVLAEQLDLLRRELGRRHYRDVVLPEKLHLDLPAAVGAEFARAFRIRLVEQTTATWEQWYGMTLAFAEREGHARVPVHYAEDGWRLGYWVGTQRGMYRAGSLLADRRALLEELPGWSWDPNVEQWEQRYEALQAFAAREGHAEVPKRHAEAGVTLGTWVQHLRTDYRTGELSAERIVMIEQIPGWTWNTKTDRWEQGYTLLQQYAAREGDAKVPDIHYEDGFPLGHWRRHQRQLRDRGKLDPARQARLEQVTGWVWNIGEDSWDRAYAALQAYAEREGHSRVPTQAVIGGVQLGKWVSHQRTAYRNSRLTPEQVDRLERLPGWTWDAQEEDWDQALAALARYAARTGSAEPPKSHVEEGIRIGWWIGTQRKAYKKGDLSPERIARLEALPGWAWSPLDAAWEHGFTQLSIYVQRTGTARVPVAYITEAGFPLGQWAAVQRRRHTIVKLPAQRAKRLDSLSGWSWYGGG